MKRVIGLALLAALCIAACKKEKTPAITFPPVKDYSHKPDFKTMEWMPGHWEEKYTSMERFHESWEKVNDTFFIGKGAYLKGNDTMFKENLAILVKDTAIYYRVNNSVHFRLISNKEGDHIFENPQHDFPQRIIYKHTSESVLYARIEGKQNGKDMFEDFTMNRIK
jgi:hypothetical protein